MNRVPVYYSQKDPRWGNTSYSALGENTTIGIAGCGPTSMAMTLSTALDQEITPLDTCEWSLSHGYKAKNQGTYYSYFQPQGALYGIDVKQLNSSNIYHSTSNTARTCHQQVIDCLQAGNYVIACMGQGNWTSSGHFVLFYDYDHGDILIHDSNSTAADRSRAEAGFAQNQVKYYFIVNYNFKEADEMTEKEVRNLITETLQGQGTVVPNWAKSDPDFQLAVDLGLIQNDDRARPMGYTTRVESAIMAARAYQRGLEDGKK